MNSSNIIVIKRDGRKEQLDLNKFHAVVGWACEGLTGVSPSSLEIKSHIQFYNNIKTSEIQETLIHSASELISEDHPNYQYVAGRLINYDIRKQVFGGHDPIPLKDHVNRIIDLGFYDKDLINLFNNEEWKHLDHIVKHDRDDQLTYAAMEQYRGKYLVKNRNTGEIYETPQIACILIAAVLFSSYPKEERMKWIKDYYDAISLHYISLPTPVMAGIRTTQRQFSSCVLIDSADSLNSINATSSSIVKYVSQRAGIGVNIGRIRGIGAEVRGGQVTHTGLIPFIKYFQAAVKSCSQGGVRGGAATFYFPIWHYEAEEMLVLKNNRGTEDNRARHVDYGVQFNKLMYERLISNEDITLFSPDDVPDLYEAFFTNQDEFKKLYEKYERAYSIRKKTVRAADLFTSFMQERKDTGRIYLQNVDHANDHGSFISDIAPIYQSNLCSEIDLPTKPLNNIFDEEGEIALCTLSAINWGLIKDPADFEKWCTLSVRALDQLLTYQDYPVIAAQRATENRRPLGVGIINFAYWLAKNDLNYQDIDTNGLNLIDEYAEAWSYYLIKASADLAEEKGECPYNYQTKYSLGITPNQTYKKDLDELVKHQERMPWKELREQLKKTGIRNSTLMALMPSETSSQISNSTNGIEPPRSLVSVKQSKDGVLKQVVPEIRRLKNKYDLLWNQKSPLGYLKIVSVLQKYVDQGISVNTSYNPLHYEGEKISMSEMLQHLILFYKWGGKQLYYYNTYDGAGELAFDDKQTEIIQEQNEIIDDYCDSCVI